MCILTTSPVCSRHLAPLKPKNKSTLFGYLCTLMHQRFQQIQLRKNSFLSIKSTINSKMLLLNTSNELFWDSPNFDFFTSRCLDRATFGHGSDCRDALGGGEGRAKCARRGEPSYLPEQTPEASGAPSLFRWWRVANQISYCFLFETTVARIYPPSTQPSQPHPLLTTTQPSILTSPHYGSASLFVRHHNRSLSFRNLSLTGVTHLSSG